MLHKLREQKIAVYRIQDATEFWTLLDQIFQNRSDLMFNIREGLLDAYVKHTLFTLRVVETSKLFADPQREDLAAFLQSATPSWILMPAFCIMKDDSTCEVMWMRDDLKEEGLESVFHDTLNIVDDVPETVNFVDFLCHDTTDDRVTDHTDPE